MQSGKKIFEFPQQDIRDLIKYMKSKQDLDLLLGQWQSFLLYSQNQVEYFVQQEIKNEGVNSIKTLTVNFTCCDPQSQRPILYFVSENGQSYELQNTSLYLHKHQSKPNKNLIKLDSNDKKSLSTLESNKNVLNQTASFVKRNVEIQNQQNYQNLVGNDNKVDKKLVQNRMEEELNSDQKVMELQLNKNGEQQKQQNIQLKVQNSISDQKENLLNIQSFDFPLESQMKLLQEFDGIEALKRAFQSLLEQPHHKDKKIKVIFQQKKLFSAVIGSRVNICFQCCNEQHDVSFFTYSSEDNKKYKLSKSYDLRHFHDIKDQKKQNIPNQKQEISNKQNTQRLITDKVNQSLSHINCDNSNHELFSEDKSENNESSVSKNDQQMIQFMPMQFQRMEKQIQQKGQESNQMQNENEEQSDSSLSFLLPLSHDFKSKSLSKKSSSNQAQKVNLKNRQQQPMPSKTKTFQSLIRLRQLNQKQSININNEYDSPKYEQIYQFPTKQQLLTIKGWGYGNILNSLNRIIKKHPSQNYEFHFQWYYSSSQVQRKIQNFKIYFYCCRGIQNKVSYLHFSRLKGEQYELINYQNQHDHSRKQNLQKKLISKEKFYQMIRQKRTQQQKLNHSQAIKISAQYPQQVFLFPSAEFLYKMKKKTGKQIIDAMGKQVYRIKGQKKYLKQGISISTIQDSTDHYLEFNFTCCKGFKDKKPFIRFSIQNDSQYYIVTQSRWHDHRKKPQNNRKNNQKSIENKREKKDVQVKKNILQEQNKNATKKQKEQIKQTFLVLNNQFNQIKINTNYQFHNIPIEIQRMQEKKIQNQNQSCLQEKPKNITQMIEQSKENNSNEKQNQNVQKVPQIKQNTFTKNKDLIFDFPSKDQVQKLRCCNQKDIQNILKQIIDQNPSKRIKYQIQKSKIVQKNGQTRDNLTVNFNCCKYNIKNTPYLIFLRKQGQTQYFLGPQFKRHQHVLDENQQKNPVNLQMEHKNDLAYQTAQQIKTVSKQLSSGKKYVEKDQQFQSQQKQNSPGKTKQIQKSPKRNECHKKSVIDSNQEYSKRYEEIEENQYKSQKIDKQQKFNNIMTNSSKIVQNLCISEQNKMIDQKHQNNKQSQLQEEEKSHCEQQVQMSPQQQKQAILEQIQSFYENVIKFISQKKEKKIIKSENIDQQIVKGQLRSCFPQIQINRDIDFDIWKQCIFQVIEGNNLVSLQFQCEQNHQKQQFEFQNTIFVRKHLNQNNDNKVLKQLSSSQIKEVYLSVHPFTLNQNLQNLKILLAFTNNQNNQLEILWFYIYKQKLRKINIGSILNDNQNHEQLLQVFKVCIKHLKIKKAEFIFTTFDYQLMKTLDKICSTNSQFDFSSSMHPCCIKKLFCNTIILEDSPLGSEINQKIKKSSNFQRIKESYFELNNIFTKNHQQKGVFQNPRKVIENFIIFIESFSNNQKEKFLHQTSIQWLLKNFICSENDVLNQNSSLKQIDQIFTQQKQFSHIAQVFILIVATFDHFKSSSHLNSKQSAKKRIVPFGLYQIRKQCKIFNTIFDRGQTFPFKIEKIFAESAYQMSFIIEKCPRYIIQTMYRLIIAANLLALFNQKQNLCQIQSFNNQLYRDYQQSQNLYKVQIINETGKTSYQQNPTKKWLCTCSFYNQTGLPCEHEILTVLKTKDSVYKEISSIWKI